MVQYLGLKDDAVCGQNILVFENPFTSTLNQFWRLEAPGSKSP